MRDSSYPKATRSPEQNGEINYPRSGEITSDDVRRWLARAKAAGNYFLVFRPLFRIMSKLDALFLQNLVNLQSMSKIADEAGWFQCTTRYLEQMGWSQKELKARLSSLVRGGFIKTEVRGCPPLRWVWIDVEWIERRLDDSRPELDPNGPDQLDPFGPNSLDPNGTTIKGPTDPEQRQGRNSQGKREFRNAKLRGPRAASSDDVGGGVRSRAAPHRDGSPAPDATDGGTQPSAPDRDGCGPPIGDTNDTPAEEQATAPANPGANRCRSSQARTGSALPTKHQTPAKEGVSTPRTPNRGQGTPPERSLEKPRNKPVDGIQFPPSPRDRRPKTAVTPQDRHVAATLRKFARTQSWPVSPSDANWAQPVAILRRQLAKADPAGGSDLLDAVAAWYVGWYAPGKKPAIRNGLEFKQRWEWLLDLYTRHRDAAGVAESETTDPDVAFVLAELRMREWPKGSGTALPGVVAQSLKNFRAFYSRFRSARLPGGQEFLRDAVLATLGDAATYITHWFDRAWHRVKDWGDWSGDLGMFVWRPDHKDFVRAADDAVGRETGYPGGWATLARYLATSPAV